MSEAACVVLISLSPSLIFTILASIRAIRLPSLSINASILVTILPEKLLILSLLLAESLTWTSSLFVSVFCLISPLTGSSVFILFFACTLADVFGVVVVTFSATTTEGTSRKTKQMISSNFFIYINTIPANTKQQVH